MSYLLRVFENASEIVTIPNPLIFTGSATFRGAVDMSGATLTGLTLSASVVAPDDDDGAALGSTAKKWSDLFLASGAVINFNSGNALITHSAGLLTFSAGNVAFGVDATGIDVTFYGDTTAYKVWWDQNGDTNGAWYFGADTKGVLVSAYGAVTGCGVFWNPDGDTNGALSIGASGGSKGNDFLAYGATNGNYMHWDQSANSLLLVGTSSVLNIAGTTASTSSTTGALVCAGGMGVAGKAFLGETVVVTDAKAVIQGMNSFPKVTVTSLTSAATVGLTAAQVIGGFIIDAVSEANAATLPAPAGIVAAIPNCKVGTSFLLTYKNAASGAYTITVTANGASTIVGTATIGQNNTKVFQAVVTNITGSSEAVVFYSVGTLVH